LKRRKKTKLTEISVNVDVLEKNDLVAKTIREKLAHRKILALNLLSSPGSGKTSILEKTLERLKGRFKCAIIEGDVQTSLDSERLEKKGFPVILINTGLGGGGCHLEAEQVASAVEKLLEDHLGPDSQLDLILIENVGNLVCPAEFEIGEDCKITVLSITEGEDKPLKYPVAFRLSNVVLLNKLDLLPHLDFNMVLLKSNLANVHPKVKVINMSAKTGEGFDEWIDWLCEMIEKKKSGA